MIVIDMDMPISCLDCPAFATRACIKWSKHKTYSDQRTKRHKDCPIVGEIKLDKTGMIISADIHRRELNADGLN